MAAHLFACDGISELVAVLGIDNHLAYLSELTLPTNCEERGVKEWMVLSQIILYLIPGDKKTKLFHLPVSQQLSSAYVCLFDLVL